MIAKAGSILGFGLFSIQLMRFNSLDHLDVAVVKESKRTEPAYTNGIRSLIALPAVSMSIDQRAVNGLVGNSNGRPTYRIHDPTGTNKFSEVR